MKSIHAMTFCMTLAALGSILLSSCGGSCTDPFDGQQKKWACGDDPTPEQARKEFAALAHGLRKNLEALREARRKRNEPSQDICLDHIGRGAGHMAGLAAICNG